MGPDIRASILAKLKNISKQEKKATNLIIRLYFQERLLYRLSISPYKERFILKGGLFLYSLSQNLARPTKDIDFLGKQISNDMVAILKAFQEICKLEPVNDDGVSFDPDTIEIDRIKEDADYEGVRLKITGHIGNVRERLQLDIGFGDIIVPKAETLEYPTLLDSDKPEIIAYSIESAISEKFEAMISLSILNSRLKDFYDIYSLLNNNNFDGRVLNEAIYETFQKRRTSFEKEHLLFMKEFAEDEERNRQWNLLLLRNGFQPILFSEVMRKITLFLKPVYDSILVEEEFFGTWNFKDGNWEYYLV